MNNSELYHYGVKGMKWGVRRYHNKDGRFTPNGKMRYLDSDSSVTKKVKRDYNELSNREFMNKYQTTKNVYAKRVAKYGDPYMNSPLAKFGKKLAAIDKTLTKTKQKTTTKSNEDLDAPYRQPIGNGAYAVWPSKRAYLEAEANRNRGKKAADKTIAKLGKTATSEAKKELDNKIANAFKKHPELYDEFGGPDKVDDTEYLALVMMEYGFDRDIDF